MLANRVREYSITVGTGDIALGGAINGHIRFTDAFSPGDSVIYVIEDGDNYEIGTGILVDADTLARTEVSETLEAETLTKEGATAIALSGQAKVYCAATAEFLLEGDVTTAVLREAIQGEGIAVEGKLIGVGDVVMSGNEIYRDTAINDLRLAGGNSTAGGGNIILFGESHASQAGDITFRSGSDNIFQYDASSLNWDFKDKHVTNVGGFAAGGKSVLDNGATVGVEVGTDGILYAKNAAVPIVSDRVTSGTIFSVKTGGSEVGRIKTAQWEVPYGTVALPGIGFYGDSNTGLYRAGDNNIGLSTGGSVSAQFGETDIEFYRILDMNGNGINMNNASITNIGNMTIAGAQNAYLGLLHDNDTNLTIGSIAGAEPRMYLYGSANGQNNAGSLYMASASSGADLELFGGLHPVSAGDANFRSGGASWLYWNSSSNKATFGDGELEVVHTDPFVTVQGSQLSGVHWAGFEIRNQPGTLMTSLKTSYYGGVSDTVLDANNESAGIQLQTQGIQRVRVSNDGKVGLTGNSARLLDFESTSQISSGTLSHIQSYSRNSAGGTSRFSRILTSIEDNTSGGEDAAMALGIVRGGSNYDLVNLNGNGVTLGNGNVNLGATTLAGDMVVGLNAAVRAGSTSGSVYYSGGSADNKGANILMRAESHSTAASDMAFRAHSTPWMIYDYSANTINLYGNQVASSVVTHLDATYMREGGGIALTIGADGDGNSLTNNAQKVARVGMPHYATSEEPMAVFVADSDGANNTLSIGGGTSQMNAATVLNFRTASNLTTTTGTTQWQINGSGHLIGANGVGSTIRRSDTDAYIEFAGGNAGNVGGGLVMYGSTHGTNANDFVLKGGPRWISHWDDSASTLYFNEGTYHKGVTQLGFGAWPTSSIGRTGTRVGIIAHNEDATLVMANMQAGAITSGKGSRITLGARASELVDNFAGAALDGRKENSIDGDYAGYLSLVTASSGGTLTERWQVTSAGDFAGEAGNLIRRGTNADRLLISGGVASGKGANIQLYGGAHSTNANDIFFRADSNDVLTYDSSAYTWNYRGTRQVGVTQVVQGTVGNDLRLSGGSTDVLGGNIRLRGEGHATEAGDIVFLSDNTVKLRWDHSASIWNAVTNGFTGLTEMRRGATNDEITISGGSANNLGGNAVFFGESHASQADDILFRTGTTNRMQWDSSNSFWNMHGSAFSGLTSISRGSSTSSSQYSGGSTPSLGSNIIMYAESHGSLANDFKVRSGTSDILHYNNSTNTWDFMGTTVTGLSATYDDISLGTAAEPGLAFTNDQDTGLFWDRDGVIGISSQGVKAGEWGGSGSRVANGNAGTPSYSFLADNDSGWYSIGGNNLGLSTGGLQRWQVTASGELVFVNASTIRRSIDDSIMYVAGGNASNKGANIILHGGSHATNAGDFIFRNGNTAVFNHDVSANLLNANENRFIAKSRGGTGLPAIGAYANDSQYAFETFNSSASNAAQFYVKHVNDAVYLGNARGTVHFADDLSVGAQNALHDVTGTAHAITVAGSTAGTSTGYLEIQGYRTAADVGVLGKLSFHNFNSTDAGNTKEVATIEAWSEGFNTEAGQLRFYTHSTGTTRAQQWSILSTGELVGNNGAWIRKSSASSSMNVSGGSSASNGGNMTLFGGAHATRAGDIEFRTDGTAQLHWDDSGQQWHFEGNPLVHVDSVKRGTNNGSLALSGGSELSNGGNIVLYSESHASKPGSVEIRSDAGVVGAFNAVTDDWAFSNKNFRDIGDMVLSGNDIHRNVDSDVLRLSGSSGTSVGANMVLWGASAEASNASDIWFRVGTDTKLKWENGGGFWDFKSNDIVGVGTIVMNTDQAMYRNVATGTTTISGGDSNGSGAFVGLRGPGHATEASDIIFGVDAGTKMKWDNSANHWDMPTLNLTFSGNTIKGRYFHQKSDTSDAIFAGGSDATSGGNIMVYGENHATQADVIRLRTGTTDRLKWNPSLSAWDYGTNIITGVSDMNRGSTTGQMYVAGGSTLNNGGNVILYGESHATRANDIVFRRGSTNILEFDSSSNKWDFKFHRLQNTVDMPSDFAAHFQNDATTTPDILELQFGTTPDDNISRFIRCVDTTTTRMIVYSDGDITNHDNSYGGISDERLKTAIEPAKSQLEDIIWLGNNLINYQMKSDVKQYGKSKAKVLLGLSAQKLMERCPSLVRADNEDELSVRYSPIYLKNVKATAELAAKNAALEERVANLEKMLEALVA